MGTFSVTIEIGDLQGQQFEEVEALVDTGATLTTIPAVVLRRLGITPSRRGTFKLADGRHMEMDIGRALVRVAGAEEIVPVVFGDGEAQPLLGAVTLEVLFLAVDPVEKRLVPVEGLLMAEQRDEL